MYKKDITMPMLESVASFAAEWWQSKILGNIKNTSEEHQKFILSMINRELQSKKIEKSIKFKEALMLEIFEELKKKPNSKIVLKTDFEPVGMLKNVAREYGIDDLLFCLPNQTTMYVGCDYIACKEEEKECEYIYKGPTFTQSLAIDGKLIN